MTIKEDVSSLQGKFVVLAGVNREDSLDTHLSFSLSDILPVDC